MSDEKKYNWFSTMPLIEKAGDKFISSTRLKKKSRNKNMIVVGLTWLLLTSLSLYMWISIFKWLGW